MESCRRSREWSSIKRSRAGQGRGKSHRGPRGTKTGSEVRGNQVYEGESEFAPLKEKKGEEKKRAHASSLTLDMIYTFPDKNCNTVVIL